MANARKGQAALEFLTTYGWAILVIAIVLVALGWLGVFRVAGDVPDRCAFQQTVACSAAKVSLVQSSMRLAPLVLENRGSLALIITGISCTNNAEKGASLSTTFGTPKRLEPGQKMDVVGSTLVICHDYFGGSPASGRYQVGDTYNGRIELRYRTDSDPTTSTYGDPPLSRIIYGDLTAKVQPG